MTGRYFIIVFILGLVGTATELSADSGVKEFISKNCTSCHGNEKQKGDVRLDDLKGDISTEGSRWALVLQQVSSGAMPPEEAKRQPTNEEKKALAAWVTLQLGAHAQLKPNLGNLVPHALLFGSPENAKNAAQAPAPRLWRLSPSGYLGWVDDVARRAPQGIVQPFSGSPERGLKDFAGLARVDEPTTEVLMRNATLIVEGQTRYEIKDGKFQGKNESVREFVELMNPAVSPTREQLEKAIHKQFTLAVGRRATADEVTRLLALYDKCAIGGDKPSALQLTLTAVLLQSDAIFRSELGGPEGMLTPHEAALAVSAALMHRREQRICDAAEKGELTTREQIATHVRRILDDPKLQKPRLAGFFREYLEYGNATEIFKDEPKDLWHRPEQHVKDTDRLVDYLLAQDNDVFRQMLLTPLAFVNAKIGKDKQTRQEKLERSLVPNEHNQRGKQSLESFYGLEEWPQEQPITQKPDTRIGILMQPSWLIAWSENFNNDIVRRGRFIRERLLGGTVPDLPIGVAAMVPDEKHRTLRDRVSSATRAEACWKCHQHMDDLGLPFENFDHYGRLITAEQVLDSDATAKNVDKKGKPLGDVFKGVPLDTTGFIGRTGDPNLDGPVKSPHELITRIANSDHCRQVWIRHVFRYYMGRNETLADAATLQAADQAYLESGGSYKALIVSLLTSDSFLKRNTIKPTRQ